MCNETNIARGVAGGAEPHVCGQRGDAAHPQPQAGDPPLSLYIYIILLYIIVHILYIIVQHIRNPSRRLSLSLLQRYIIEADPLIIDYYYYYYYYYFVVSERLARSRRQHMSHEEAEPAACPIQTF